MAFSPGSRSYYEVLGVAREATAEEIHRAYRRLARQCHPDVNPRTDARARFDELSAAYEVLHDPQERARYDRRSSASARQPPRPATRAPRFTPARPEREVPRFLDDNVRRPAGDPVRTRLSLVIAWDLSMPTRSAFGPARRRWREVRWLQ